MISIDIVFNFDQKKFLKGTLGNQTCHFINGETLEITTTVPLNMLTARDPSLVDDGSPVICTSGFIIKGGATGLGNVAQIYNFKGCSLSGVFKGTVNLYFKSGRSNSVNL